MPGESAAAVAARGLGLHLEEAGPRSAAVLPLLFIHGWGGRGRVFRHQIRHFSARRRCLAPDLPGHGLSAKPQIDYAIPVLAETLAALLEVLAVRRVIPVGHSMGALVALELARLLGPARVPALALIEPAPLLPPENVARGLEKTERLLREEGWRAAMRRLLDSAFLLPGEPDGEVRAEAEAGMRAVSPFAAEACWEAMRQYGGEEALAALAQPVAVILGARPQVDIGRWRAASSAPLLIGQTLGAGHFNLMTVPAQVNAMLSTFLERVDAGA